MKSKLISGQVHINLSRINKSYDMKKNSICIGLLLLILNSNAQTTSLDISSSLQTTVTPTSIYNAWQIIEMSPAMQTAPCYENTTFSQPPTPGLFPVSPVDLTNGPQDAYVVSNGLLSCFPYATIYTSYVNVTNVTDYSTSFRRRFFICGNTNVQATFNFDIFCDDYIQTISLDNNPMWNINQYSISPHVFFNQTVSLSPGLHTIDIKASEWQDPFGDYYTIDGNQWQWNPFAFIVTGNITTSSSVLFNYNSSASCLLPVKLIDFISVKQGNSINLNWKTVSEANVFKYEIEKSLDGTHFYTIGVVMAMDNSAIGNKYKFTDTKIDKVKTIYYRLKVVDLDGAKSYSPISVIKLKSSELSVYIIPNPVSDVLNVEVNCAQNNPGEILIADASGNTIKHFFVNFQKGQNEKKIDMSAFSNGVFLVKIKSDQDQVVLKCVKAN